MLKLLFLAVVLYELLKGRILPLIQFFLLLGLIHQNSCFLTKNVGFERQHSIVFSDFSIAKLETNHLKLNLIFLL